MAVPLGVPWGMTDDILRSIIFHTDTGSCLGVLAQWVADDPDITLDREGATQAISEARQEGYLEGEDAWLKVTRKGWDWWKVNKEPS